MSFSFTDRAPRCEGPCVYQYFRYTQNMDKLAKSSGASDSDTGSESEYFMADDALSHGISTVGKNDITLRKVDVSLAYPGEHGISFEDEEPTTYENISMPNVFIDRSPFCDDVETQQVSTEVSDYVGELNNENRMKVSEWCVANYFKNLLYLKKEYPKDWKCKVAEFMRLGKVDRPLNECTCCPIVAMVVDDEGVEHNLLDKEVLKEHNFLLGWNTLDSDRFNPESYLGINVESILVERPSGDHHMLHPQCPVFIALDMKNFDSRGGMLRAFKISDEVMPAIDNYPHWIYAEMHNVQHNMIVALYSKETYVPLQRIVIKRKFFQYEWRPSARDTDGYVQKAKFPMKPRGWDKVAQLPCCPCAAGYYMDGVYTAYDYSSENEETGLSDFESSDADSSSDEQGVHHSEGVSSDLAGVEKPPRYDKEGFAMINSDIADGTEKLEMVDINHDVQVEPCTYTTETCLNKGSLPKMVFPMNHIDFLKLFRANKFKRKQNYYLSKDNLIYKVKPKGVILGAIKLSGIRKKYRPTLFQINTELNADNIELVSTEDVFEPANDLANADLPEMKFPMCREDFNKLFVAGQLRAGETYYHFGQDMVTNKKPIIKKVAADKASQTKVKRVTFDTGPELLVEDDDSSEPSVVYDMSTSTKDEKVTGVDDSTSAFTDETLKPVLSSEGSDDDLIDLLVDQHCDVNEIVFPMTGGDFMRVYKEGLLVAGSTYYCDEKGVVSDQIVDPYKVVTHLTVGERPFFCDQGSGPETCYTFCIKAVEKRQQYLEKRRSKLIDQMNADEREALIFPIQYSVYEELSEPGQCLENIPCYLLPDGTVTNEFTVAEQQLEKDERVVVASEVDVKSYACAQDILKQRSNKQITPTTSPSIVHGAVPIAQDDTVNEGFMADAEMSDDDESGNDKGYNSLINKMMNDDELSDVFKSFLTKESARLAANGDSPRFLGKLLKEAFDKKEAIRHSKQKEPADQFIDQKVTINSLVREFAKNCGDERADDYNVPELITYAMSNTEMEIKAPYIEEVAKSDNKWLRVSVNRRDEQYGEERPPRTIDYSMAFPTFEITKFEEFHKGDTKSLVAEGYPLTTIKEYNTRKSNIQNTAKSRVRHIISGFFKLLLEDDDSDESPLCKDLSGFEDLKKFRDAFNAYTILVEPLVACIMATDFVVGGKLERNKGNWHYLPSKLFPHNTTFRGSGHFKMPLFHAAVRLPGNRRCDIGNIVKYDGGYCPLRVHGLRCHVRATYSCGGAAEGCSLALESKVDHVFYGMAEHCTKVILGEAWHAPSFLTAEVWYNGLNTLAYAGYIPYRLVGTIILCNCKNKCADDKCATAFLISSPVDYYTLTLKYANSPWFDLQKGFICRTISETAYPSVSTE